jgi:hypothetical protein
MFDRRVDQAALLASQVGQRALVLGEVRPKFLVVLRADRLGRLSFPAGRLGRRALCDRRRGAWFQVQELADLLERFAFFDPARLGPELDQVAAFIRSEVLPDANLVTLDSDAERGPFFPMDAAAHPLVVHSLAVGQELLCDLCSARCKHLGQVSDRLMWKDLAHQASLHSCSMSLRYSW